MKKFTKRLAAALAAVMTLTSVSFTAWAEGTKVDIVNANITGVVLDTTLGAGDIGNNNIVIRNLFSGRKADITGVSTTGNYTYLDAELETGVDYALIVKKNIAGTSSDVVKGFRFNEVARADINSRDNFTGGVVDTIGDLMVLTGGSIGYTRQYKNATITIDGDSFRHYDNPNTWANDSFKTNTGVITIPSTSANRTSADINVAGTSVGVVTFGTPLGDTPVKLGDVRDYLSSSAQGYEEIEKVKETDPVRYKDKTPLGIHFKEYQGDPEAVPGKEGSFPYNIVEYAPEGVDDAVTYPHSDDNGRYRLYRIYRWSPGAWDGLVDGNGNPIELNTHREVYTVTDDCFRISSDFENNGQLGLAWDYYDEGNKLGDQISFTYGTSGRRYIGIRSVSVTQHELFTPDYREVEVKLLNASEAGIIMQGNVASSGLTVDIIDVATEEEVPSQAVTSAGDNIYYKAALEIDRAYKVVGTTNDGEYVKYFKITKTRDYDGSNYNELKQVTNIANEANGSPYYPDGVKILDDDGYYIVYNMQVNVTVAPDETLNTDIVWYGDSGENPPNTLTNATSLWNNFYAYDANNTNKYLSRYYNGGAASYQYFYNNGGGRSTAVAYNYNPGFVLGRVQYQLEDGAIKTAGEASYRLIEKVPGLEDPASHMERHSYNNGILTSIFNDTEYVNHDDTEIKALSAATAIKYHYSGSQRGIYKLKRAYVTKMELINYKEFTTPINLVNADEYGIVLENAPIGAIANASKITITKAGLNAPIAIKGSSVTGKYLYVDADLEKDVVYNVSIKSGLAGSNGAYKGPDYTEKFIIREVARKDYTDFAEAMGNCSWPEVNNNRQYLRVKYWTEADGYAEPFATLYNTSLDTGSYFKNASIKVKFAPYYHHDATSTWSNDIIYTDASNNNKKLTFYWASSSDVAAAYRSKANITTPVPDLGHEFNTPLKATPVKLGMIYEPVQNGAYEVNGKKCRLTPGCFDSALVDKNDNLIVPNPTIERYIMTDDALRIYTDGDKLAYDFYDENNILGNDLKLQFGTSSRLVYGFYYYSVTQMEKVENFDPVEEVEIINADESGVVVKLPIGGVASANGFTIKNAASGAIVPITSVDSVGDNIYLNASLKIGSIYQLKVADDGIVGANGYYAGDEYKVNFKIKVVEDTTTKWAFKNENVVKGTDQNGEFFANPNGLNVETDSRLNYTVKVRRAHYTNANKGKSYGTTTVKAQTLYHCGNTYPWSIRAYDYGYGVSSGNPYSDTVVDNTVPYGFYQPASESGTGLPAVDASGLPVILTETDAINERYNIAGDVIAIYINDNLGYSRQDSRINTPGTVRFNDSLEGVLKFYEYQVTEMEIIEGTADLNVTKISADNKEIKVTFDSDVSECVNFNGISVLANGEDVNVTFRAEGNDIIITPVGGIVSEAVYSVTVEEDFGPYPFITVPETVTRNFKVTVYADEDFNGAIANSNIQVSGEKHFVDGGMLFNGTLGIDDEEIADATDLTVKFDYKTYLLLNDNYEEYDPAWNYNTSVPQTMMWIGAPVFGIAPQNGYFWQMTAEAVDTWKNVNGDSTKVASGTASATAYGDVYCNNGNANIIPKGYNFGDNDMFILGSDEEDFIDSCTHEAKLYAYTINKNGANAYIYKDGKLINTMLGTAESGYFGINASNIEYIWIDNLVAYTFEEIGDLTVSLDVAAGKAVITNFGSRVNAVVVVAAYDANNKMLDSYLAPAAAYENGNTDVAYTLNVAGAKTYKAFVWDNLTNLNPLSKPATVKN